MTRNRTARQSSDAPNGTQRAAAALQSYVGGSYSSEFFQGQADPSHKSAMSVVPLVLSLYPARSVVDVGCGTGAWLAAFEAHGVEDVFGVDGDYVPNELLRISQDNFSARDLREPVVLERTFDLAVCLEVAEHLSAGAAPVLVESLIRLAPVVLFSAAVPMQGGTEHVNEQWQDYWVDLFASHAYVAVDCLRSQLWNHPDVQWYYAQNSFLMVSEEVIASNSAFAALDLRASIPTRIVHPIFFEARMRDLADATVFPLRTLLSATLFATRRTAARRGAEVYARIKGAHADG